MPLGCSQNSTAAVKVSIALLTVKRHAAVVAPHNVNSLLGTIPQRRYQHAISVVEGFAAFTGHTNGRAKLNAGCSLSSTELRVVSDRL